METEMTRPVYGRSTSRAGGLLGGLVEDLAAIALVGLVVLGLGGVIYKLFKPEGLGSSLLGYLWDKSPWLVWLAAFAVAAITLAGRHAAIGTRGTRGGNVFTYLLVALGVFFLFKLLITGSL
jgi:hypothetical protein